MLPMPMTITVSNVCNFRYLFIVHWFIFYIFYIGTVLICMQMSILVFRMTFSVNKMISFCDCRVFINIHCTSFLHIHCWLRYAACCYVHAGRRHKCARSSRIQTDAADKGLGWFHRMQTFTTRQYSSKLRSAAVTEILHANNTCYFLCFICSTILLLQQSKT